MSDPTDAHDLSITLLHIPIYTVPSFTSQEAVDRILQIVLGTESKSNVGTSVSLVLGSEPHFFSAIDYQQNCGNANTVLAHREGASAYGKSRRRRIVAFRSAKERPHTERKPTNQACSPNSECWWMLLASSLPDGSG